jgi:hypothetical protein
MPDYRAIEAFARGAMSAFFTQGETPPAHAVRKTRRRRSQAQPDAAPTPSPRQLDLHLEPIVAPGAPPEMPASPLSQAEVERMERVLRGEAPNGSYKPSEGVAPWMES